MSLIIKFAGNFFNQNITKDLLVNFQYFPMSIPAPESNYIRASCKTFASDASHKKEQQSPQFALLIKKLIEFEIKTFNTKF